MRKQSWFILLLFRIGLIKSFEVDKSKMCKRARDICDKNCDCCAWGER